MKRQGQDAGISLIEMVIAVLILSVGVIAGFRSLGQSQRAIGAELPRLLAQTVALNRAEELKLLGADAGRSLPSSVTMGPFDWAVAVDEAATQGGFVEATVRVSAEGHPGAMVVVYVPRVLEP